MNILACMVLLLGGSAWSITYRDTTLSGQLTTSAVLAGTITVAGFLSNTPETVIDILPGTVLKGQGSVTFHNLTAEGTARDSIRFDSLSSIMVKIGILDYCALGRVDTEGKVIISHARMREVTSHSGPLQVRSSIVRAKTVYAASGASFSFYNSLFPDSTFMAVNSIQNNNGSSGFFTNCTFARGLANRAVSAATQAVSIQYKNCAFVDSLKAVKGDPANYVHFNHCMGAESLFVDAAGGDLHLRDDSPAKDTGAADPFNTLASARDLDGLPRIHGRAVDLGAFENQPITVFIDPARPKSRKPGAFLRNGRYLEIASEPRREGGGSLEVLDVKGRRLWSGAILPE